MPTRKEPPLRLVVADKDAAPPTTSPLCHRSRRGVAYYLHKGATKRGLARFFFAKTIGEGSLVEMPKGYEIAESINGVVSVRKVTPGSRLIPPADADVVRDALALEPHLRGCAVEVKGDAIIIFEPERGRPGPDEMRAFARELGVLGQRIAARFEAKATSGRYTPVMKFERAFVGDTGQYLAFRRTYRGEGGWLPLSHGPLATIVGKYVHHIGRESFFELF